MWCPKDGTVTGVCCTTSCPWWVELEEQCSIRLIAISLRELLRIEQRKVDQKVEQRLSEIVETAQTQIGEET